MKILYIGSTGGTSGVRAKALERMGHTVTLVDPTLSIKNGQLGANWLMRLGGIGMEYVVLPYLKKQIKTGTWDVLWVDAGAWVGPKTLTWLERLAPKRLLYCNDNPFVPRDGLRWELLKKALPKYDLFATPREPTRIAGLKAGARRVHRFYFAADEVDHSAQKLSAEEIARYGSKVSFIGTWMEDRDQFVAELVQAGVPVKVFGSRWEKSPRYAEIKDVVAGKGLSVAEYTKAVQAADICIGLLSEGNQDEHTQRSVEVPAIGSVLCALRTPEHMEMYKENEEAVFFDTAEECASVCLDLLKNPEKIKSIAAAGHARSLVNRTYYELQMGDILKDLFAA